MRFCPLEPGAHLDLMTKCNVTEGGGGTVSHIPPSGPCDAASVILPGGRQWVCLDAHFTEWAVCAVMGHLWGPGPEPLAQGQTQGAAVRGPHLACTPRSRLGYWGPLGRLLSRGSWEKPLP